MNTSCQIRFSVTDVSADTDGQREATQKQSWVDLAQLADDQQTIQKYATLESDGFPLDGSCSLFPDSPADAFMGWWSDNLSDENGQFDTPPVLTATFTKPHSSVGITIIGSAITNDWPNHLKIQWLDLSGNALSSKEFWPDSAEYFCENQVENYGKVIITFYGTNKPQHWLKVTGIRWGLILNLAGNRLVKAKVTEEVHPISAKLPIGQLSATFYSPNGTYDLADPSDTYKMFQQRQKAEVWERMDGSRIQIGTYYLQTIKTDGDLSEMECGDLLSVLDGTDYLGGMWLDGIQVGELIGSIFESAGLSERYQIEDALSALTVKGYLPISTHREALQQVAFAIGAVVNTARSDFVRIYPLDAQPAGEINLSDKVMGHTLSQEEQVTGVEVYAHSYRLGESRELYADTCAVGDKLIKFDSPSKNLYVSGATLKESGVNYVKVTVATAGTVKVTGETYEDSTYLAGSYYMNALPANTSENVQTIDSCTLMGDAAAMAKRIYDYYQMRIVDEGQLLPGSWETGRKYKMHRKGGKSMTGVMESMDLDLLGGCLSKIKMVGLTGE